MKKIFIILITVLILSGCAGISDLANEEENLYAEYAVENGEIVLGKGMINDGTVVDDDKIIWNKIKEITPAKYMSMITKYQVFTDGLDGKLAYVHVNDDNKTWTISVDLDDTLDENKEFKEESVKTIIHEMSHIIALNESQMGGNASDKELYTVTEGTLNKDSYLSKFYNEFWKHHMSEHSKNSELDNTDEDNEESFYNRYKDEFVSGYAASNPVEDFSESFAHFVINDKPSDKNIKSQKVAFFYNYPEFVKIRNDIRTTIGLNK